MIIVSHEQIISTILARAEGNPFYLEEFVRMLIEKDVLKPSGGKWRAEERREQPGGKVGRPDKGKHAGGHEVEERPVVTGVVLP